MAITKSTTSAATHPAAGGLGQVGLEWQVAGVGRFNGTDTADMILRDSNNGAFEVYDIGNNTDHQRRRHGPSRAGMAVAGFGDFSSRAGETDMLMRNSNTGAVRDLRHRQQRHHFGRADGASRPRMVGRGFRRFLDAAQRNRHVDAQQQYRAVRALRHQQQRRSPRRHRWAKSDWNGRWRDLATSPATPTKPTC